MTDLKLCPFCGSEGEVRRVGFPPSDPTPDYYPTCTGDDCPCNNIAEQDEQGGVMHGYRTEVEAIAAWNKRPAEDDLAACVRGLLGRVEELEGVAAATLKQYHENQDHCGEVYKELHAVTAKNRELETELESLPRWEIAPDDEYRSDDYAYELNYNVLWRMKLPKGDAE
jgi:hypothetical protein